MVEVKYRLRDMIAVQWSDVRPYVPAGIRH